MAGLSSRPFNGDSPLRIAFFAPSLVEYPNRVACGLRRFQLDSPRELVIRDYRFLNTTQEHRDRFAATEPPWRAWNPHGIISMVSWELADAMMAWAQEVPLVNASSDCAGVIPTVRTCHNSIAELAQSHFKNRGLAALAFVGLRSIPAMEARKVAFCKRIDDSRSGVANPPLTYDLEHNPTAGTADLEILAAREAGLHRFLSSAPKPLGILAGNDRIGCAVCSACEILGLPIPSDVAVLGVGDTMAARTASPPLSSISSPCEESGYRAMELLLQMLDGKRLPAKTVVDVPATQLVERTSTAIQLVPDVSRMPSQDDVILQRARRLIREHACDGRSIEDILSEIPVPRKTIDRSFKRIGGGTLHEELQRVRMERAKELLRMTSLPISQIAQMTGYANASALTHAFSRNVHMSPRRFRNIRATEGEASEV